MIDPSPVIRVVKCSRTTVLVSNTQGIHTIWPICRLVVSPTLLITLILITIQMKIIALIPPLPHLPIITCKPYYQLYLLSEHKMPPRFGTPEQTKKGPTPKTPLRNQDTHWRSRKDLHRISGTPTIIFKKLLQYPIK